MSGEPMALPVAREAPAAPRTAAAVPLNIHERDAYAWLLVVAGQHTPAEVCFKTDVPRSMVLRMLGVKRRLGHEAESFKDFHAANIRATDMELGTFGTRKGQW